PIGVAAYVVSELAAALAYAHALTDDDGRPLSIVHRDVSPSNIMVTRAGKVKLLDFGIAKAANGLSDVRTRTGAIRGKLGYLAPEQLDGLPIDRRVDLFALGVVFHECLTLERLFRGSDDFHTMRLVREARVSAPSLYRADVEADIDAVVLRMVARKPEDRF